MSLAGQTMPARESQHSSREEVATGREEQKNQTRSSYRDSLPNAPRPPVYSDDAENENETAKMYGEYYDDEMTKKAQPKQQQAPELPAKSSLRASRLLDSMALKIITNQPNNNSQAPQEVYLSSEEEASSSADEFSDYDYESDSAESAESPVRRKSHEDTARVVSVVFAGKPSIIDLPSTRRSASPESMESRPSSRMVSSSTAPSLRRMSTASTSASSYSPVFHPARSSSMMFTSSMLPKDRPSFLSIDPCASKTYEERSVEEQQVEVERPERPKTPTSALFRRTLSIVRKRSRPQLRDLAANNSSRDKLSSPSLQHLPLSANSLMSTNSDLKEEPEQTVKTPNSPWPTITYQEIMRAAKKNSQTNQPPTPSTPNVQSPASPAGNTRSRILSGFASRRKSIKIG
ncbi:hypothetical protein CMUS01_02971 [Colletotrichum musicola]|uniref:Uncharacterized protein n=1 Tax=Colletotrichum musicola TaxID=2175873 RepID=A0A8H6NTX1_9PEZI|nr:hypothetical protein CMUS01_02971 [Colletotrichum musicola]